MSLPDYQKTKMHGFLNIRKESGMTAHDVVAKVRRIVGLKQVGHGGTLDPMAEGVLTVAIGKACRLLRFLASDKTYLAEILFGLSTDTDDIEGKASGISSTAAPELVKIEEALLDFKGKIEQTPPVYSAVHVKGERLYKLARKGEIPDKIPSRKVEIFSLELIDYSKQIESKNIAAKLKIAGSAPEFAATAESRSNFALLKLRIHCSAGTYIRSIARDLGKKLGSPACLYSLMREQAGPLKLDSAITLSELLEKKENGDLTQLLIRPESALQLDRVEIDENDCRKLSFGQKLKISAGNFSESYCQAIYQDKLVAICSRQNCLQEQSQSLEIELKPEVLIWNGSAI